MTTPVSRLYLVVDNASAAALSYEWDCFDQTPIDSAEVLFQTEHDVALVAVQFAARHDPSPWIGLVLARGFAIIDPERMGEADRQAFGASYLPTYEVVIQGCQTIADALGALRTRLARRHPGAGAGYAGLGDPNASSGGPAHPDDSVSRSFEPARGTLPPQAAQLPPPTEAAQAVEVRFLRGGQWSPARLRSLSTRGAYLITAAPPRVNDEVHVALACGELAALIRGSVYHVTTASDAATSGITGFAVSFAPDPTPARARLIELLQRARASGIVLQPPPPRVAMRFPVRWPVVLEGEDGGRAEALDVSQTGLFVTPPLPFRSRTLTARIVTDTGSEPIEARARIARSVTPVDAMTRGLTPGHGLEIVDMSDRDRDKWQRFLARVERRSARTVLVGAAPARLELLAHALADAGYAVSSSADPGTLIRLTDSGAMPDLAVIDDSLLEAGVTASWLEQMFTARSVPCLRVRGEPVGVRLEADRLLDIPT